MKLYDFYSIKNQKDYNSKFYNYLKNGILNFPQPLLFQS